ncbi:hypothetical protein EZS27_001334 [termite gut metagenome]|uniref:Uncharacterized protein n=1 Tax=termite gut metagenome TaxID=433724 RepID=A0A5J4T156_9ZZZZ
MVKGKNLIVGKFREEGSNLVFYLLKGRVVCTDCSHP